MDNAAKTKLVRIITWPAHMLAGWIFAGRREELLPEEYFKAGARLTETSGRLSGRLFEQTEISGPDAADFLRAMGRNA
jgi:hypothetical protein